MGYGLKLRHRSRNIWHVETGEIIIPSSYNKSCKDQNSKGDSSWLELDEEIIPLEGTIYFSWHMSGGEHSTSCGAYISGAKLEGEPFKIAWHSRDTIGKNANSSSTEVWSKPKNKQSITRVRTDCGGGNGGGCCEYHASGTITKWLSKKSKVKYFVVNGTCENGTIQGIGTYVQGTSVTLTAIPNEGYEFVQWEDGSIEPTRTIIVESDINVTATFKVKAVERYYVTNKEYSGRYISIFSNVYNDFENHPEKKNAIKHLQFVKDFKPTPQDVEVLSLNKEGTIKAYMNDTNGTYTVASDGLICVEGDCSYMMGDLFYCETLDLGNFDMSECTIANYMFMNFSKNATSHCDLPLIKVDAIEQMKYWLRYSYFNKITMPSYNDNTYIDFILEDTHCEILDASRMKQGQGKNLFGYYKNRITIVNNWMILPSITTDFDKYPCSPTGQFYLADGTVVSAKVNYSSEVGGYLPNTFYVNNPKG